MTDKDEDYQRSPRSAPGGQLINASTDVAPNTNTDDHFVAADTVVADKVNPTLSKQMVTNLHFDPNAYIFVDQLLLGNGRGESPAVKHPHCEGVPLPDVLPVQVLLLEAQAQFQERAKKGDPA